MKNQLSSITVSNPSSLSDHAKEIADAVPQNTLTEQPQQLQPQPQLLPHAYLQELVDLLRDTPEDVGIKLLCHQSTEGNDCTSQKQLTTLLRHTSAELFQQIESLHQSYMAIVQPDTKGMDREISLSGLSQLYVSTSESTFSNAGDGDKVENDSSVPLDAETIWGQVELQNMALQKVIKRSLRQLFQHATLSKHHQSSDQHASIRLLYEENDDADDIDDGDEIEDDDDDDEQGNDDANSDDVDVDNDVGEEDDDATTTDDENLDEETKRVRKRMQRTMDEVSDEDEDNDDDGEDEDEDTDNDEEDTGDDDNKKSKSATTKKIVQAGINDEEIENDPAALQLHDGFFNLQEMEDFADEEEEYLPNDAYGTIEVTAKEPKGKNLDQRTFHQKQRDGDMIHTNESASDDSDDYDEEDDDAAGELMFGVKEDPILHRRKKYREDEDIEALYHLYDTAPTSTDVDEDDDVIHMTAADLFGAPNRKFYNQWNQKIKKQGDRSFKNDNNDDEYEDNMNDFNTMNGSSKSGWNDVKYAENEDDDENDKSDNEDDDNGAEQETDENSDEEIKMKSDPISKTKQTQKISGKQSSTSKLLQQTEQLERDMLAEKPWQMKGETGSSARPVNSLLDSTPEFEVATKINPIITVAHTANLEEIIKQRILDEDWDDVLPRELPDVGWNKKRGELPEVSQEKSKLGLGELYEREYLKKAVGYDVDAAEKLSTEDKLKNEMKSLFANLCSKLDALSNYHFTPRPLSGDTEVRPITVPAIAMEEVLPIHISDARGVAPEEVYGTKKRGRDAILRDVSEMDQQERKRLRNSKKSARRKDRRSKLADEKLISRLEPNLGLNNPYEKRKVREELSMARAGGRVTMGASDKNDKYGTSHTFFQRLQQEAEQTIRDGGKDVSAADGAAAKKRKSAASSAYKL
jgi:U3 small nucleolar RNA-associated protein MPP10